MDFRGPMHAISDDFLTLAFTFVLFVLFCLLLVHHGWVSRLVCFRLSNETAQFDAPNVFVPFV